MSDFESLPDLLWILAILFFWIVPLFRRGKKGTPPVQERGETSPPPVILTQEEIWRKLREALSPGPEWEPEMVEAELEPESEAEKAPEKLVEAKGPVSPVVEQPLVSLASVGEEGEAPQPEPEQEAEKIEAKVEIAIAQSIHPLKLAVDGVEIRQGFIWHEILLPPVACREERFL